VALPVRLLFFHAQPRGGGSHLQWATGTESNSAGFGIERSTDGRRFADIGFVASAAPGGNSAQQLDYAFTDASLPMTGAFYRLRQYDLDGRATYSPIAFVRSGDQVESRAWVSGGCLWLSIQNSQRGPARLELLGNDGKLHAARELMVAPGSQLIDMRAPASAGIWYLRVTATDGAVQVIPFVNR
jgi:hypothetical protein